MKYLDALNERNKENQARKNIAMGRPTTPTDKPGKHSTEGKLRGRTSRPPQKVRGVKIRAGDTSDVTTAGKTGETTASNRLIGKNRPFADLAVKHHTAGPKGKLPGKKKLEVSHTVYKQIGMAIAEAADRGFYKSKAARASETAQATDERKPGQPLKPARSRDAGASRSLSSQEKSLVKKGVERMASKLGVPSKSINPRTAAAVQVGARATRKSNTEKRIGGVGNASRPRPGQNPVGS